MTTRGILFLLFTVLVNLKIHKDKYEKKELNSGAGQFEFCFIAVSYLYLIDLLLFKKTHP
jgi:hypothetical protein